MANDFQRNNEQAACSLIDRMVMIYQNPPEPVLDSGGEPVDHPDTGVPMMKPAERLIDEKTATALKEQCHDNPFNEETDLEAGNVKIDLQVVSRYGRQHKVNSTHHGRPKGFAAATTVNGLYAEWGFTGARGWLVNTSEGHKVVRLPGGGWRAEIEKVAKGKKAKPIKKKYKKKTERSEEEAIEKDVG